ncbi:hypothetical protein ARMGADRAFT_1038214 [Armillaria gallica]|uniref:Uncharacterized protein n=1 Tax=Armillaria gallica TaxID=47427 RepID=A0A2H3CWS7_ARMGA|nr:hypothetical protein ARMGADRAFT_1038214 [Armillaria gallica]
MSPQDLPENMILVSRDMVVALYTALRTRVTNEEMKTVGGKNVMKAFSKWVERVGEEERRKGHLRISLQQQGYGNPTQEAHQHTSSFSIFPDPKGWRTEQASNTSLAHSMSYPWHATNTPCKVSSDSNPSIGDTTAVQRISSGEECLSGGTVCTQQEFWKVTSTTVTAMTLEQPKIENRGHGGESKMLPIRNGDIRLKERWLIAIPWYILGDTSGRKFNCQYTSFQIGMISMVWGAFPLRRHFSLQTPPGTGLKNIAPSSA